MRELDKLCKDYKLQTRKGIKIVAKQKTIEAIGSIIGIALLAILFSYNVLWITGFNFPYLLDFFATLVLVGLGPKKHQPIIIRLIWITFIVCLLCWYAGATPLINHR